MEKLSHTTESILDENVEKLAELFPEVVTEVREPDGSLRHTIDVDALRECVGDVAEGHRERYQFTWPGKREAKQEAYRQIDKCLRPCPEESVDWDTTGNLYIEGDNLDALKLLRNTYAGKVKMIYIDPPYNTGHDFIYDDDFAQTKGDYDAESGDYDEDGGRLVANPESNGRFHSDWCSMMLPRLLLARDLLSEDGVIFVSISDAEHSSLKKLLDEVFGEGNCCADVLWHSTKSVTNTALISVGHTHNYVYFKSGQWFVSNRDKFRIPDKGEGFSNPDNDPRGPWKADPFQVGGWRPNQQYEITNPSTGVVYKPNPGCSWKNDYSKYLQLVEDNRIVFGRTGEGGPLRKRFLSEALERGSVATTWWDDVETTTNGTQLLKKLLGGGYFDNPKPVGLLLRMLQLGTNIDSLVLDFFSGSATTAHAVMQLNAEDDGNRKFIMVQLPEVCDEKSEAAKAGYKNICEIGKERIRRAGRKIAEEVEESNRQLKLGEKPKEVPDIGFRVLKIDSSNFEDVSAEPGELSQDAMLRFSDNLKLDRTADDLIIQVMLKKQIELSAPIEKLDVDGCTVFSVDNGRLVACFDRDVPVEVMTAMAKMEPDYAVMRDASFTGDDAVSNFAEIFKNYSSITEVEVI